MDWARKRPDWTRHDRDIFQDAQDEDTFAAASTVLHAIKSQPRPVRYGPFRSDLEWNNWFEKDLLSLGDQPEYGLWVLLAGKSESSDPVDDTSHNPAQLQYLPWSNVTFTKLIDRFFIHGSIARTINRGNAEFQRTHAPAKAAPATQKQPEAIAANNNAAENGEQAVVYNVRTSNDWPHDLALSVTYFPVRGVTYAVFYGCTPRQTEDINGRLKNSDGAFLHPLLLPGILAEMERERQRQIVFDDTLKLTNASNGLSQVRPGNWDEEAEVSDEKVGDDGGLRQVPIGTTFAATPAARAIGSGSRIAEDETDRPYSATAAMSRWMAVHNLKNGLMSWQTQMREMIKHVQELDQKFFFPVPNVGDIVNGKKWTQKMVDDGLVEEPLRAKQRETGERIRERLEAILEEYDELIRKCVLNMDGMALATSLAHTKANMHVALSTRRDSSQMKSIALVTMVFLPGTFFATFFSMTFFEWQPDNGKHVVAEQLWIYMLFTAVFTAITVGFWVWFNSRRGRRWLMKILPCLRRKNKNS